MRVIRDAELATWTFVPVSSAEEQVLSSIAATVKPGDKMGYNGRSDDSEGYCAVRLHAGGHQEDIKEGNVTRMGVWMGGIDFVLEGSDVADKQEVGCIRDTCFFGTGGLIYLGSIEVEGKKAIVVTGSYCKLCGAAMIGLLCEWKVCDACSAKCSHQWERGMVHGGSAGDIGVGEYCTICGRGKPRANGEPEPSQLERHLAVEREFGVQIIYKDTGLTPSQIAHLQQMASEDD